MLRTERLAYIFLLTILLLNFAVIDPLTTFIAVKLGLQELNGFINLDLIFVQKVIGSILLLLVAEWTFRKNAEMTVKTLGILAIGFTGITLNNLAAITGVMLGW